MITRSPDHPEAPAEALDEARVEEFAGKLLEMCAASTVTLMVDIAGP